MGTKKLEITKGWQWLLYVYLVLPLLLLAVATLLRSSQFGISFARLFHSYNLYMINPIPDPASRTGFFGLVLPVYPLYLAVRHRDRVDLALSVLLVALNALYFFYEINYFFIPYLSFA